MFRRIVPHYGDRDLIAHPHRLLLSGQPADMAFPPVCVHCGAAATDQIQRDKVFERGGSDGPASFLHTWVWLPVCTACAAQHHRQVQPPTPVQRLLSAAATFDMAGAAVLASGALAVAALALKDLLRGRLLSGGLLLGLVALFAVLAHAQRRAAWDATAHRRVPEPGDVARSLDFSDDIAPAFEKPRYAVTMQNAAFAAAFEALNAARLYRPGEPAAVEAAQKAKLKTVWLVVGLVILAIVLTWFAG